MKDIDKRTRLTNYLIDMLAILFLCFLLIIPFRENATHPLIFSSIMLGYYLLLEGTTGQTLGKLVTKTKVVSKDGTNPKFFKIVMRSFWRLIPFDALSYLFGKEFGMHDVWSSTKLTKVTKK